MKALKTIRNYALMKRAYEKLYGGGTYTFSWFQIVRNSFFGWPSRKGRLK